LQNYKHHPNAFMLDSNPLMFPTLYYINLTETLTKNLGRVENMRGFLSNIKPYGWSL